MTKREITEPIREQMEKYSLTAEQVFAELDMMAAASERFRTGNLTAEDRREMARCTRDFYDNGQRGWGR